MIVRFRTWDCTLHFREYANGNIAILLEDVRDGQPVATATINPNVKLSPEYVCIKDYSENTGMLDALIEAGVVEPEDEIPMGYANAHICKLLVKPE